MASTSSPASCLTKCVWVAQPQGSATAGAIATISAAASTIRPILRPVILPPWSGWKVSESVLHRGDARALALRLDLPLHVRDPVGLVHVDECGLEVRQLLLVVRPEGSDDHQVPFAHLAGGGAVQADHAGAGLPLDRVSGEPVPVVHVPDMHLLVFDQPRRLHERLVDGDAPLVVEHRLGHGGPVDLAFQHRAQHHESPPSRAILSISLSGPTRAATRTVTRSERPSIGNRVSESRASAYSNFARGSASISARAAAASAAAARSPEANNPRARESPRERHRAALRSSPCRYLFRELIARPSASRTIGAPTIRTSMFRSRAIRRMTASCWKSFSPKTATCGFPIISSFATTVATPRKWPGRKAPHSPFETSITSMKVWNPCGYMSATAGRKTAEVPAARSIERSRASSRGYFSKSSPGPNCVGLTKIVAATASQPCSRAIRTRLTCPSRRYAIVGARPIRLFRARCSSAHACTSRGRRKIATRTNAPCPGTSPPGPRRRTPSRLPTPASRAPRTASRTSAGTRRKDPEDPASRGPARRTGAPRRSRSSGSRGAS